MTADWLRAFPDAKVPQSASDIKSPNRTPTVLYNGMLHPLVGYSMRGVIWYQGISPFIAFGDSVLNGTIRLVNVSNDRIIKYGKAFFIDNHSDIVLLLLQRYDR